MTHFKARNLTALLLVLILLVSMFSTTALAAEDEYITDFEAESEIIIEEEPTEELPEAEESSEEVPEIEESSEVSDVPTSGTIPGSNIQWELTEGGMLLISGSGCCAAFSSAADQPWAAVREQITSVFFEDPSLLSIYDLAYWFDGCVSLTTAEIPYTTPVIGTHAFYGCVSLTTIMTYYGDSVLTEIGADAFYLPYDSGSTLYIGYLIGYPESTVPLHTYDWTGSNRSSLYFMVDRKFLKNPNGLILGTPGSGKSFAAKREIANVFFVTNDDIIICDPEAEYGPLVERLHGQVIKISPTSPHFINPMDLNLNYSDDENPLSLKSDFILSLCELIVGGKDGLQPVEKTIIDRCVRLIYRNYLNDPRPENMPVLEDLYHELRRQEEKEAQYVATALEIYVTGSLNVFNHRTNVDIQNRIVAFDIKELGKQLKKIGMLIVQDQVWNRVTVNREAHKSTRYYIDEFHLLLKEEQTAAYSVEIWKRFRKWGGVPTGVTQNVKDLLSSREVENIFENSDYIYMLNQASGDRQILAKQLNISPHQLSYVTHSGEGEGLLFYGNIILPFVDRFPKDTELYRVMTTKPNEVSGA